MLKRLLLSLFLAFVTLELIGALYHLLPYSEALSSIKDALSYPGGLLTAPFFPQGVHGEGGIHWPLFAYLGNLFFYAAIWFAGLSLFPRLRAWRNQGFRP
jgi:hypothetical protein